MVMALDKFAKKYGVGEKSSGSKVEAIYQKQWNSSTWMEIPTPNMFVRTVQE